MTGQAGGPITYQAQEYQLAPYLSKRLVQDMFSLSGLPVQSTVQEGSHTLTECLLIKDAALSSTHINNGCLQNQHTSVIEHRMSLLIVLTFSDTTPSSYAGQAMNPLHKGGQPCMQLTTSHHMVSSIVS